MVTDFAMTGKEVKDTPVQSQAERDKTVAANESGSERSSEGEIPVELINRQPFDDFPIAHRVLRINGVFEAEKRILKKLF